jgi:hypothetical protein
MKKISTDLCFSSSKVGAPLEVVGRLCALADEIESDSVGRRLDDPPDPELDEFMVIY